MNRLPPSHRTAGASRATTLIQRAPLQPSRLEQCLLLAVLLHILLVLALGNTPGGTAAPGEGVWGRLNVTLRASLDLRPGEEPGGAAPTPPEVNIGATGAARPQQRYGGALRRESEPRPPADTPGAAQLGQWQPQPQSEPSLPHAPTIEPIPEPIPEPVQLVMPEPTPAVVRSLAPPPATTVQRLAPASALSAAAVPVATAVEALPALPTLRARRAPAAQPPSLSPASLPSAAEALKPLPSFDPPVPAVAVQDLAPPAVAPSADTAPLPALAQTPPATAATPNPIAPPHSTAASPNTRPQPVLAGAPDAGARVGHDVAMPPSTPPSAPRLNLNLPLPRGGPLSSRGSPGALPLLPHPPEVKSKLAQELEKATSSDCRKAYSEMGVLAAAPLAADALRKKGCRW
jgi:hypothetical protein